MKSDCKFIQSFKKLEARLQQHSMFSIKKRIENYYEDTINGIEGDKDALEMELHGVRYIYNVLNGFASNFVWLFLSGLVGFLFKIKSIDNTVLSFIFLASIFLAILACQWFFLRNANTAYEEMEVVKAELEKIKESKSKCEEMKVSEAELNEMKLIKAELEKINNTIQPNPEKISIRISNRSSVRRSIFGR